MNILKGHLRKENDDANKMRSFIAGRRQNNEAANQISDFNERMRRRCQHELQMSKSEVDSYKNKIFELEQNKQLYIIKYQVLEKQFQLLFSSINEIADSKNIQDKFEQEIVNLRDNIT